MTKRYAKSLNPATGGYGATAARLTPDQKVGSSNLSALMFVHLSNFSYYAPERVKFGKWHPELSLPFLGKLDPTSPKTKTSNVGRGHKNYQYTPRFVCDGRSGPVGPVGRSVAELET